MIIILVNIYTETRTIQICRVPLLRDVQGCLLVRFGACGLVPLQGAAPGCCKMSTAVCTLELECWRVLLQ